MPQTDPIARAYYNKQYHEQKQEREQLRSDQLAYGLEQEKHAMPVLNQFFKDNLQPTPKYCPYDFTGLLTKNLYELKSNMYSLALYPTVVLDLQKVEAHRFTSNFILVFSFKEDDRIDFYYIPFDYDTFKGYPIRQIHLRRGGINTVVDIPKSAMARINLKL